MTGTFSVVSGRNTSAYKIVPSRRGICTSFSTISFRSRGWEILAVAVSMQFPLEYSDETKNFSHR